MRRARGEGEVWVAAPWQRLRAVIGEDVVEFGSMEVGPAGAAAACAALASGKAVSPHRLMTRPAGSGTLVHAVPPLLQRGAGRMLLPPVDTLLQQDDRALCCGRKRARTTMRHNLLSQVLAGAGKRGVVHDALHVGGAAA